jgi:PPIC-type PPIASE domain
MHRMLRLCVIVLVAGLVGCSNFRELFSAHADVAAEAGGQQLAADRLAAIMTPAGKSIRVNRETADFVVNAWIDYMLLGQAVVTGRLPMDSASIAEALWPDIAELKGSHWHDTLMERRAKVPEAAADSLYRDTDVRVLQHILIGVRPNTDSATQKKARKKAETTLVRLKGGANFSQLAAQISEDPGSKADSGFLPPSPKGRFVPSFDSAGWILQPGQMSGLVRTAFGFHIIKRPTLGEVRERLMDYLAGRAGAHLDSLYMDSLAISNKLEVVPGAPAAMRAAVQSPEDSKDSKRTLVRYHGGELTVKDYLRWVRALPPQYAMQLKGGNDSMLVRFARILTQNTLLLREADSAHIAITKQEWDTLSHHYRTQLDTLRVEVGLNQSDLTDASTPLPERQKLADLKVDQYFDRLTQGKARLRPLPSALATLLRQRFPYRVNDAGVNRAVEIAKGLKEKSDSANKGGMQPAPGGPPIPAPVPQSSTKKPDSAPGNPDSVGVRSDSTKSTRAK